MEGTIGIVDLFSGPGGLGEGFCSLRDENGRPVFEIDLSVEKDRVAHSTLRLRAFLRKFPKGFPQEYIDFLNRGGTDEPDWAELYPTEWRAAETEAQNLTLGSPEAMKIVFKRLSEIRKRRGDSLILIGGPPCQAYSLAGRGRKPSELGYVPHAENRHLLYAEYIKVLRELRPAAFVMENVKGMLSSSIEKKKVFELVSDDLRKGGGACDYRLIPLSAEHAREDDIQPRSFVVEAERQGVPQARHRVIIVGIRRDLLEGREDVPLPNLRHTDDTATVRDVLDLMPKLRSGLSSRGGTRDDMNDWKAVVARAACSLLDEDVPLVGEARIAFRNALKNVSSASQIKVSRRIADQGGTEFPPSCPSDLVEWLQDRRLERLVQHETRGHMKSDLARYLFAASWTTATGISPKAHNFPDSLAPDHNNWQSGKFNDRFRVQPWNEPSSTVTCHLSKDGHYFIHPDPMQCRSMTVREAARLQTFPDNYFFKGNRTEQYIQVGNAVPPYLAWKIAQSLEPTFRTILSPRAESSGVLEGLKEPA